MYLSEKSLQAEYDISRTTVWRMVKYIQNRVETGIYASDSILYIGGRARISNDVFRRALEDKERERVTR